MLKSILYIKQLYSDLPPKIRTVSLVRFPNLNKLKKDKTEVYSQVQKPVVLEALKERMTMADLAQKFKVSPVQISNWKREFLSNAESVFGKRSKSEEKSEADLENERLLQMIG